jgi:hypothetical protein
MYEVDVHYDLTYFISMMAGLNDMQSQSVAFFDQYVDENPDTLPFSWGNMPSTIKNYFNGTTKNYHFISREEATTRVMNAIASYALAALGTALHSYQDTYSHAGYIDNHAKDGHNPDKTYLDPGKALTMAKGTFILLRKANAFFNGIGDMKQEDYDKETDTIWSTGQGQIKTYLELEDKKDTEIYKAAEKAKNNKREQIKPSSKSKK